MHINVWYEGLDVKVGEQFEKDNVVIMLILPNGDEERIDCKNAQFLNTVVEKEGINWYTVICYINHTIYQRKFSVNGYIPVEHPDLDFSVYYIDKHNQKIDYTEKFKDKSLREKDEIRAYYRKKMEMYLSQTQILVVKKSYDRMERLDIKPQIEKYVFNIDDSVDVILSAGPRSNISPAILMDGYSEYINEVVPYEVKRKKILYS